MNERDEPTRATTDEAVARLRAADPAAGHATDLVALRGAVDARLADATVAPLAARRRSSTWLRAAAVAAGALLVGSAGFGLGRAGGTGDAPGGETLDGGGVSGPTVPGPAGDAAVGRAEATSLIYPAPWLERATYRAEGLPTSAGTAPTWGFDPTAAFTAERVAALASAVGLEGEPSLADGAWTSGSTDGTGAHLMVAADGAATVSYFDPAADPYSCGAIAEEGGERGSEPFGGCATADLGPAPGEDVVLERTRELLAAAGQDVAEYELVAAEEEGLGAELAQVVAHELAAGARTGGAWYVTMSSAGVQSFSGRTADLVDLGDYPVVSATEAVERLTDPRYGQLGGGVSLMREDAPVAADLPADVEIRPEGTAPEGADTAVTEPGPAERGVSNEPPQPVSPGGNVPWPVEDVTITEAVLGHVQYTTPDGATVLVPAWELGDAEDRSWTVLALAETALDLQP